MNVMVMDGQCCTIYLPRQESQMHVTYLKRCNVQTSFSSLSLRVGSGFVVFFFFDQLMLYGFMSFLRGGTLARSKKERFMRSSCRFDSMVIDVSFRGLLRVSRWIAGLYQ